MKTVIYIHIHIDLVFSFTITNMINEIKGIREYISILEPSFPSSYKFDCHKLDLILVNYRKIDCIHL